MPMRPLRLTRKQSWINAGFLQFEADALASVPLNVPYGRKMRQERYQQYKKAILEGWTEKQYVPMIMHLYSVRGWWTPGTRPGRSEAFAMLRWYEAEWKVTAPANVVESWVSPSAKVSHHGVSLNTERLRQQRRDYNSRPEVIAKRSAYRRTHREQIRETERKRRAFIRSQGTAR